jgi:hypothetical protein
VTQASLPFAGDDRADSVDEITLFCSHDPQMLEAAQRQPAAA